MDLSETTVGVLRAQSDAPAGLMPQLCQTYSEGGGLAGTLERVLENVRVNVKVYSWCYYMMRAESGKAQPETYSQDHTLAHCLNL